MRPLTLKQVIIISTGVALALNVGQLTRDALASRKATVATSKPASDQAGTRATTVTPAPTPKATPLPDPSVAVVATLAKAGLRSEWAPLYLAVQARTGTPWQILAAVHTVETHQAGSTSRRSYAGATGPMQFMPATFRAYAIDGDGNGVRDITDLEDAMFSAGNYLRAGGAANGRIRNALYNYNHSWSYVSKVQGIASRLGL